MNPGHTRRTKDGVGHCLPGMRVHDGEILGPHRDVYACYFVCPWSPTGSCLHACPCSGHLLSCVLLVGLCFVCEPESLPQIFSGNGFVIEEEGRPSPPATSLPSDPLPLLKPGLVLWSTSNPCGTVGGSSVSAWRRAWLTRPLPGGRFYP